VIIQCRQQGASPCPAGFQEAEVCLET
jgi:hypothetical protein